MDSNVLEIFKPDPDAVFQQVKPYIRDGFLRSIAELDHGYDREENFVELKRMRDEPYEGLQLQFNPAAVLELGSRGPSYPETSQTSGPITGEDADLCQAFIVANILRSFPNCGYDGLWESELFAVSALLGLGRKLETLDQVNVASLFAWLLPLLPEHDVEAPFIAVALIDLAALQIS